MLKKVYTTLVTEAKNRGLYFMILMNLSHVVGITRAMFYKMLYIRNIQASIFSLQANSKIEIFNKRSKLKIGNDFSKRAVGENR